MRLCFDCLLARTGWLERYMLGWYLLMLYGGVAFLALDRPVSIAAQAAFFLALFPLILWPVIAALRPVRSIASRSSIKKAKSPQA